MLAPAKVKEQLRRPSCRIELAQPLAKKLDSQEICRRARASYLRVGWYYLCTHCDEWRLTLGGGYLLSPDGALGTAYHVIDPPHDLRKGILIAMDDDNKVFPVMEILAANRYSDACILRIKGDHFTPLPFSTNVSAGNQVYCLSDPADRRGVFSEGTVKRLFSLPERRLPYASGAPLFAPMRIEASVEWSFGSSGAPLLDECGNVVGHASTISVEKENNKTAPNAAAPAVFHEAVSARDMLELIKRH